jgi:hypothetical protein
MTTDHWIQIIGFTVTSLCTLLSPLVPDVVRKVSGFTRKLRERLKRNGGVIESQSQEERLRQRKWITRNLYYVSSVCLVVSAVILWREFTLPNPITREALGIIAYYTGIFLYHFLMMNIYAVRNRISELQDTAHATYQHLEKITLILSSMAANQQSALDTKDNDSEHGTS